MIELNKQYKLLKDFIFCAKSEILGTDGVQTGGIELFGELIDGVSSEDAALFWTYLAAHGMTKDVGMEPNFVIPAGQAFTIFEESGGDYGVKLTPDLNVYVVGPFVFEASEYIEGENILISEM